MPTYAPTVTPDAKVDAARAERRRTAPRYKDAISYAVELLAETGAIPRDGWRQLAFILYARAVYATFVRPVEEHLTLQEVANHLEELQVPRFRGSSAWSGPAITDLRAVVADPNNRVLLPAPRPTQ